MSHSQQVVDLGFKAKLLATTQRACFGPIIIWVSPNRAWHRAGVRWVLHSRMNRANELGTKLRKGRLCHPRSFLYFPTLCLLPPWHHTVLSFTLLKQETESWARFREWDSKEPILHDPVLQDKALECHNDRSLTVNKVRHKPFHLTVFLEAESTTQGTSTFFSP